MLHSPLNATDPSGHNFHCNNVTDPFAQQKCEDVTGPDPEPLPSEPDPFEGYENAMGVLNGAYRTSLAYGILFVIWLIRNQGWWTPYMTGDDAMWQFLVALVIGWETSTAWEDVDYRMPQAQAIMNRYWDFVKKYGVAGRFIWLGSYQVVRIRNDLAYGRKTNYNKTGLQQDPDQPGYLSEVLPVVQGYWYTAAWDEDPNRFYDIGNLYEGTSPQTLKEMLEYCRDAYGVLAGIKCEYVGTGSDQIAYLKVDQAGVAFVLSYQQFIYWGSRPR